MRPTPNLNIERYRILGPPRTNNGAFIVPFEAVQLRIIASDGMGWEHVSVSTEKRCPRWAEMAYIKHLFFNESETVMQLHVRSASHINMHPYCLHLWRPQNAEIPLPPEEMV
jgi:hypothetical protein